MNCKDCAFLRECEHKFKLAIYEEDYMACQEIDSCDYLAEAAESRAN